MKYTLQKPVFGGVPRIDISGEQYREYETAHAVLSNALAIEEKYEVLIWNYIDFEKQILDTATENMVRRNVDYSDFFGVRLGFNVRLVNLLTSARLYVEQLTQHAARCIPSEENVKEYVKSLFSKEYDNYFEYRFMEALRNYVQHKALPVHATSQGVSRVDTEEGFRLAYSSDLATLKSNLKKDGGYKKAVLEEIDDKVDLKETTRCYIERLSNVQYTVRERVNPSAQKARDLFEDARKQYGQLYKESLVGLSACKWEDDQVIASVPIIVEWDDVRQQLVKRNRSLGSLSKTYVTGDLKTHNK